MTLTKTTFAVIIGTFSEGAKDGGGFFGGLGGIFSSWLACKLMSGSYHLLIPLTSISIGRDVGANVNP